MGSTGGVALKALQWFVRAVQFCCAALILAIYSYFLATLSNHNLAIARWVRAVEGISGAGVVYTVLGLLLLCCLAGHPVTSALAIVLDVAFVGAFAYVAVANRHGAGMCTGTVTTPYGTGDADTGVPVGANNGGTTVLPNMHQACKMETACLAVAIVAIIAFVISALLEVALVRHHRKERRFGPSPANNYTSGYGRKAGGAGAIGGGRRRFAFPMFPRRSRRAGTVANSDALPGHTQPDQVDGAYGTKYESGYSGGGAAATAPSRHGQGDSRYNGGVYDRV